MHNKACFTGRLGRGHLKTNYAPGASGGTKAKFVWSWCEAPQHQNRALSCHSYRLKRDAFTSAHAIQANDRDETRCTPITRINPTTLASSLSNVSKATAFLSATVLALSLHGLSLPYEALAKAIMTPDEQLTINIFKKSTPAVVNVINIASRRDAYTMNMLEMPQGAGSGFILDKEGHVVTNFHVITDAQTVKVTLSGGNEYDASVVGVDQDKDIAVLQIQAKDGEAWQPLDVCSSSSDIVVGQKVFAIGNPFGLDHTLTTGVVSGTGREILSLSGRPIQDVIQTDAAINPGNSGGPLLDSGGCVIGINTAIYSATGANSGVGFAIPVDIVRSSVDQILKFGKVVRPVLGIAFAPDQASEQLGLKGVLVLNAREGGPAWKAGIKGTSRDEFGRLVLGDIIVQLNKAKVRNASDLYRVLDKCKVGDTLEIEVLRGNTTENIKVTLEANA